jgi:hypothetical protein
MSQTFQAILQLIERGEVRVSAHGYDELAEDGLFVRDVLVNIVDAVIVEDYPTIRRVHVFWCFKATGKATPSMSCGAFRKTPLHQRFW